VIAAVDEDRLDDVTAIEAADPSGMLRAVASSAAQVRESATLAREAGVTRLANDGRPRAVLVAGMGGSGIAGDVLGAVAGSTSAVPVLTHRGYGLPGWAGPADLVIAVSCSGGTQETLSAAEEALRRGCRVLTVGAADSPLAAIAQQGRAIHVPVTQRLSPRSTMWALATPLVVAADALGLLSGPPGLEQTAERLEAIAESCRPDRESFVNPGKTLALDLSTSLAMVWGSGPLTGVAAYRTVCQLAENAKQPAVAGVLPEADHNQVVTFDGAMAGRPDPDDIFRDRVEEEAQVQLRLLLLREATEDAKAARRADISAELARDRGVPVTEVRAEGATAYEQLASVVALVDYATVYLAVMLGIDPTPVAPIDELKRRLAE
jgi:glucose/mannose-6-phosphate isomerase